MLTQQHQFDQMTVEKCALENFMVILRNLCHLAITLPPAPWLQKIEISCFFSEKNGQSMLINDHHQWVRGYYDDYFNETKKRRKKESWLVVVPFGFSKDTVNPFSHVTKKTILLWSIHWVNLASIYLPFFGQKRLRNYLVLQLCTRIYV